MANESKGRLLGLAHIGVMVKDIEKSIDFYTNTLGFEVMSVQDMGRMKLVFLQAGTCIIELVPVNETEDRKPGPVDHICLEVEDIGPFVERLKEKGVKLEKETYSDVGLFGGIRNIFFRGPDDERIEFFDYMKK